MQKFLKLCLLMVCFIVSGVASISGASAQAQSSEAGEMSFTTTILDDLEKIEGLVENYFAGYIVMYNDEDGAELEFNDEGVCTFDVEDGYVCLIAFYAEPESVVLNSEALEAEVDDSDPDTPVYIYTFKPTAGGHLNITFGDMTTPEEPETNTFTVYIKADCGDAVVATVYGGATPVANAVGTDYTAVSCPIGGEIRCTISDVSLYAFMSFVNEHPVSIDGEGNTTEVDPLSYLDYDAPTEYPVVIRATRATGNESAIDNNGAHFAVTTQDKRNLAHYQLTLNIVDDASAVKVEVGPQRTVSSQANHVIGGLGLGANTIDFTENDKYMVVSSTSMQAIYQVVNDKGVAVTRQIDTTPYYYLPLGEDIAGGTVTVTALEPIEEGNKTFTFTIDHPELVTSLRRFVGGTYMDITEFVEGANPVTFSAGNSFRLFLSTDFTPEYVTLNDTPLEGWSGIYDFTPADDDVVVVHYGELPALPTFTVVTDKPEEVKIINNVHEHTYALTEEYTTIEFFEGDTFDVYINNGEPRRVLIDDDDALHSGMYYHFVPSDGSTLKVIFENEPTPPVVELPTFTLYIDEPDELIELWDKEDMITDEFVKGANELSIGSGLLTLYVTDAAAEFTVDGHSVSMSKKGRNKYYDFEVSAGSVVIVKYSTDPVFTFITDDASKIACQGLDIAVGANNFTCAEGTTYSFTTEGAPLAVKIGANAIAPVDGVYSFTPADGDVVKVFFNYEPACTGDVYTVKASYTHEGCDDFINYAYIGDTPLANINAFFTGNIVVDKGTEININYKNYYYIINGISVNGTARTQFTGALNFTVNKNTEIVFDVEAPHVINYSVVTECPADVELYYPDSAQQSGKIAIALEMPDTDGGTSYSIVTDDLHSTLVIEKVDGVEAFIDVRRGASDIVADEYGRFVIDLEDGDVINISRRAVTYDETFVIVIDVDATGSPYAGMERGATLSTLSGRVIDIRPGRNVISFNSDYDRALKYGFGIMPANIHTYHNDEEIATSSDYLNMFYLLTPTDGDIVRTYYRYATTTVMTDVHDETTGEVIGQTEDIVEVDVPCEKVDLVFDIDDELLDNILIVREGIQTVHDGDNHFASETASELYGTVYSVYIRTGYGVSMVVTNLNAGSASAEGVNKVGAVNDGARVTLPDYTPIAGYTHVETFSIIKPIKIALATAEGIMTGVDSVTDGTDASADVFNLQGITVKTSAAEGELEALPAGIYIYGGKKVIIK